MDCGLPSSTTPGLIIAQSCLTSCEGPPPSAWPPVSTGGRQREDSEEERRKQREPEWERVNPVNVRWWWGVGGQTETREEAEGVFKKEKETLWAAAEIAPFFYSPFAVFFHLTCRVTGRRWPGPPKFFSTRPSGRPPATLSVCLCALVRVLRQPPQWSVRAQSSTESDPSSTLHVTWSASFLQPEPKMFPNETQIKLPTRPYLHSGELLLKVMHAICISVNHCCISN